MDIGLGKHESSKPNPPATQLQPGAVSPPAQDKKPREVQPPLAGQAGL